MADMNEKNSPKDKVTLHKSVIEQHLKTNFFEKKTKNEQDSPKERTNSSPLVKLQTFLTNSKENKIKKDFRNLKLNFIYKISSLAFNIKSN